LLTNRYLDLFTGFPNLARAIHFAGLLGVNVFFVISGFVICRLLIVEENRYGSVSLKGFYYRRAFRILPPLYVYLAAVVILRFAGLIRETHAGLIYAALFLFDLKSTPNSWFFGHTWSLAVEEQFYLIFPTMWILTPPRWRSRAVAATFLMFVVLSLLLLIPPFDRGLSSAFRLGFVGISLGAWMAINEERLRKVAARVPSVAVAAVGFILLYRPVGTGLSLGLLLFGSIYTPLGVGLILMYSLERGKWLRALLSSKPLQAIGMTSYAIYLWQEIFTARSNAYTDAGMVLGTLLPLLLVVIPLSYFLLEKPAMRIGRTLSRQAREAASMKTKTVVQNTCA
jgi:peptidoglycan/LPS O-acetylase OafA/YrhL